MKKSEKSESVIADITEYVLHMQCGRVSQPVATGKSVADVDASRAHHLQKALNEGRPYPTFKTVLRVIRGSVCEESEV